MRAESDLDNADKPPMSRLFVVCGKHTTEQSIREEFSRFGFIQKIWFVKDRNSGENKGIAYVKFLKTSDAAAAFEEMNGKIIDNEEKPIKVFVASSRSSGVCKKDRDEERYLRLFIIVSKSTTKTEILDEFQKYGKIDTVTIIKNKKTRESKGVAYVKFKKFLGAAIAFENCPQKYKAVFAAPRPTDEDNRENPYKRARMEEEKDYFRGGTGKYDNYVSGDNMFNKFIELKHEKPVSCTLEVISSKNLNQDQLWRVFDIIPGLDYCRIAEESGPRNQNVIVVYTNPQSALFAKNKLHGLEYPPGERLIIRISSNENYEKKIPDKVSEDWFCSVKLSSPKPILNADAYCVARCFIVLTSNIPVAILKNVFCTFGSLIDVYLLHNKNCGYVKYGNISSAESAIHTLNNAEICGIKIKVMIADAPRESNKRNDLD